MICREKMKWIQLFNCSAAVLTLLLSVLAPHLWPICEATLLQCSNATSQFRLTHLQLHTSSADYISTKESITARGCFLSVSPSDGNTSITAFINQQNGSTISQSTLDTSSGCFAMDFRLEEAGDHTLELTLGQLGGGTCNGSIPLLLEVYQQESCYYLAVFDANFSSFGVIHILEEANLSLWVQIEDSGSETMETQLSLKYASLGAKPVVTITNGTVELNTVVEWNHEHFAWSVTIEDNITSQEYNIDIQMFPPNVGSCSVNGWHGTIIVSSKVPVLSWISEVAMISSDPEIKFFEGASGEDVITAHLLQEYHPEIAIAAKGLTVIFTWNNFQAPPYQTFQLCSLAQLTETQCSSTAILDMAITQTYVLILTSMGLLVSSDPGVYPPLYFVEDATLFSVQGAHFLKQRSSFFNEVDIITVNVPTCSVLTSPDTVLYRATPPFKDRQAWNVSTAMFGCGVELQIAFDFQRNTYIVATSNSTGTFAYLMDKVGTVLNTVELQHSFLLTAIYYHPPTASTYLFGNQVLISIDGGHTFQHLLPLPSGETVVDFVVNDGALAVLTSGGSIYYGRPGTSRIMQLGSVLLPPNATELVFCTGGTLNALIFKGNITSSSIPVFSLLQKHKSSDSPCILGSQVVTDNMVFLYSTESTSCLVGSHIGLSASGSLGNGVVVELMPQNRGALVAIFETAESKVTEYSEWSFKEDKCWLQLHGRKGFDEQVHELDLGDHLELQVELTLINPGSESLANLLHSALPKHLDISVTFGNPNLFDFQTTTNHNLTASTLALHVWQRSYTPALSTVTFQCVHCSLRCKDTMLMVVISSSCPSDKHLKFVYPEKQQHHKLAVNYRPPSWLGTAIPTSPHIYNADPSRPLMNTHYEISKKSAQFKQCSNSSTRSGCNCSQDLKTSTDINYSDCIVKAYRHPFSEPLPLHFRIHLEGGIMAPVEHSIEIKELNNRTDFEQGGSVTTPTDLTFEGPGLYHFRATVLTNSSLCHLTTQFTVYVDRVPLMKATEYSLTIGTTVLFGIITSSCIFYITVFTSIINNSAQ